MDFTTVPAGSSSCAGENKEKRGGGSKRSSNSSNSSGNKGVRLSTDPQSIAARERRHRISDRFKILQSLVPGGTRMDTVSMLEEAIHYVKFLKTQIWLHQTMMTNFTNEDHDPPISSSLPFAATSSSTSSHHLPPPLHQSLYTSNLPAAAVLPSPLTTPSSLPPYIYQGDEAEFYRESHSSNY